MPQPDNMVFLVTQFALFDGSANVEIAEFGMYGSFSWDPGDDASWQAALGALAAADLAAWTSNVAVSHFSAGAILSTAIATRQNTTGHAVQEAREVPSGTPWQGTADLSLPWEVSMCINLYTYMRGTFVPHNRRRRGRIYLPPLGASTIGNEFSGKMGATQVTDILSDVHDYLSDLATTDLGASGHRWEPQVLSKVGNSVAGVVQLSTDDRFDSQRRREKQQPVTVHSVDFP